jgi:uncharacterized protein (DUF362 family)
MIHVEKELYSSSGRLSRRSFLKGAAAAGASAMLPLSLWPRISLGAEDANVSGEIPDLVVAQGGTPAANCLAAVTALGGFSRFVQPGNLVFIKPNPVARARPEQAIHTHPDIVEAVVRGCLAAGARKVVVGSNDSLRDMRFNGTAQAVERGGGELKAVEQPEAFREVLVPRGRILRRERIIADLADADVFINLPIAKHNAATGVTLTMKNLMGVNWDRMNFHQTDIHQCIAELTSVIPHHLIVMDANHVLLTNGPVGPGEVRVAGQVIAGTDPVAVDTFTANAFFRGADEYRCIRAAYDLGVGEMDLSRLRIREIKA